MCCIQEQYKLFLLFIWTATLFHATWENNYEYYILNINNNIICKIMLKIAFNPL